MTDYEKGLEKLGLWKPNEPCSGPYYNGLPLRCIPHHRIDTHDVPYTDIREDLAFAWRVLEAMYSSQDDMAQDAWEEFWSLAMELSLLDALYAAVEALGRDK